MTSPEDRRRMILLGASNVTIGFSLVLENLPAPPEGRMQVFAAIGHGRSYGAWSRVLGRDLPGILGCGLWEALAQVPAPGGPPFALVTDVGNDLLYGSSVPQIAEWLESCLERLQAQQAEIVMTLLPMARVRRLPAWQYYVARTLFFPRSRIAWAETLARADALNDRMIELGERFCARVIEPPGDWYSIDPIHIRFRGLERAWGQILSSWPGIEEPPSMRRPAWGKRWRIRRTRPAERRFFGIRQTAPQPTLVDDRISLWLY